MPIFNFSAKSHIESRHIARLVQSLAVKSEFSNLRKPHSSWKSILGEQIILFLLSPIIFSSFSNLGFLPYEMYVICLRYTPLALFTCTTALSRLSLSTKPFIPFLRSCFLTVSAVSIKNPSA